MTLLARSYAIQRDKQSLPGFKRPLAASQSYYPGQICASYNWPTGISVVPLTITIGSLGGSYYPIDLPLWATRSNLPAPTITKHLLSGADDSPSDADGETCLDWELAAQVYSYMTGLPARILIAYGPNSGQAFADVNNYVSTLQGIGSLSWSWGQYETGWSSNDRSSFDQSCQKAYYPICSASGDNGSSDGTGSSTTDFPSSSPYNIGCGGTSKVPNGGSEVVWNNGNGDGAGGGFSKYYTRPSWQPANSQGSGRMVPDWAAVADPSTGYDVIVNGQWQVFGGTSAVAPLMAGFLAVVNGARLFKGLPMLNSQQVLSTIWSNSSYFYDVVNGSNGSYKATTGSDPCSGLGRALPGLFSVLVNVGVTPTPTPVPTPVPTPTPTPPQPTITLTQDIPAGTLVKFNNAKPKGVYAKTATAASEHIEVD